MRAQKQVFLEVGPTEKRESLRSWQVPVVKASPMMLRARALKSNHDGQTHSIDPYLYSRTCGRDQ